MHLAVNAGIFFLSPGVVMSLSGMIIFFFLWKDIFVQYLKKYHQ